MATKEEKLEKLKKAKKDYQEKVIKAGKKAKEKLKKPAKKAGKAIGDSGVGTKIVAATAALTLGGAMNDANAQTYQGGTGTTKTVTMNGITFQMSTPTPEEQARLDATNRARQQATGRAPQSGYTQSGGYRQNQGGYQSGGYAQN
ncbi:MAG: hypothetical protein J6W96_04650, partial [Alphaproteobacteria bacterium]|nr:hypothetical protein [Alphaproteobacteria bacterium]